MLTEPELPNRSTAATLCAPSQPADAANRAPIPLVLRFKRLRETAIAPRKAHPEDAGLDVFAYEDVFCPRGATTVIDTGLAFEPPDGWAMIIRARSSQAKKDAIIQGLIDPGYRGEVRVIMHLLPGDGPGVSYKAGEKIAQLVLIPVPLIELVEALPGEQLTPSQRGAKGFGSSGA